MKPLDATLKLVLILALAWWGLNLPIARTSAQSGASVDAATFADLKASAERQRDVLAEIKATVDRLKVAVESPAKPTDAPKPTPAPEAGDAIARDLGAKYRAAVVQAHGDALEAVAGATDAATLADLIAVQAKAAADGRKRASAPIVAELAKRFGDPGEGGDAAGARKFYEELAAGYKEGAK